MSVPSSSPGLPSPEFFCATALPDRSVLFGLSWDGPEPASSWNIEKKLASQNKQPNAKPQAALSCLEWKVLLGQYCLGKTDLGS